MRGRAVRDLSGPESGYILLERFPSTHGDRRHEIVTILPLLPGPHSRLDERRGSNLSSVMDVAGTHLGARLFETLRRGGHSSNGFRIPVFPSPINTGITRALCCAHMAAPRAKIRRVADLAAETQRCQPGPPMSIEAARRPTRSRGKCPAATSEARTCFIKRLLTLADGLMESNVCHSANQRQAPHSSDRC